ncbi:TRAP transporter small permease [Skermanella stibiiresistens]|uniref:TRAP transporter small permease n=1 Tax=Skermanella stibiiresistens TaxID=913326 RepID=UPI001FDFE4CB|nr:TRAP transporter small permease [Skermanella stibiiresistens]
MTRVINHLEEGFIAFLLAAMTILTFVQVVLRYVFNSGIIWGVEATSYMFAWMVLFGMSYGVRVHAHIGIDLLVKNLPGATRRVAGLIAIGLCVLYAGIMAWGSYAYISRLIRLGIEAEDIPIERWMLTVILPIGFALLGLRLLQEAYAIVSGRRSGFELADEAADVLKEQGLNVSSTDLGATDLDRKSR